MSIDLDSYSFDEWVKFVFDHPVAEDVKNSWYWDAEWEWEAYATRILENGIRLFKGPAILLERYSPEQIDQGFWFLLGATGPIRDCVWDDQVDLQLRTRAAGAVYEAFVN